MSSIQTGIELNDQFSSVLNNIVNSVNIAIPAMYDMQQSMNADINTSSIEDVREEINQTTAAINDMNDALNNQTAPDIAQPVIDTGNQEPILVDVEPIIPDPLVENPEPIRPDIQPNAPPEPVTVPIALENSSLDIPVYPVVEEQPVIEMPVRPVVEEQPVIEIPEDIPVDVSVNGVQKSEQMIETLANRLESVSQMQSAIRDTGRALYVLPENSEQEISGINREIAQIEQALEFLRTNPFNLDSSIAEMQINAISDSLDNVIEKQQHIDDLLGNAPSKIINVDVNPTIPDPLVESPEPIRPNIQPNAPPEPVEVPIQWETDNLEVFAGTGIERFQQEIHSANSMLEQLSSTQDAIAKQAYNTNLFSPEAFQDLYRLAVRIDSVRERILQIENSSVNIGTDAANSELEQLRSQLSSAIQQQNELNQAMQNMDVSAANDAYLHLSQTVSGTERYIRDNVDEQGRFNQQIQDGTSGADSLMNSIKGMIAAYVSVQSIKNALNLSDELAQTTARLEMMNDGFGDSKIESAELMNTIYASAQDARGSLQNMADVVARFGNNARDAFGSSKEVVDFANLVQKQMTIAGASTEESSNAMLQLSQALGSGVLRGDELNSIFEQAPNLIQSIADYMDVPIGKIREMASDGELSADVVKAAIFASADDINAKFAQIPMTWGQLFQSFQNSATMAFQPVLQRINEMANSPDFQNFVNSAIEAMAIIANIVLDIFDLIGTVGGFIADNWSIISPIVYGVVAALAVYGAYLAITKGIELASAAAKGVLAVAEGIHAAALMITTRATWSATTAQLGLNGAMYACPIVWIIVLIIALVAVIITLCNWIAKVTGIAESGIGVVCGLLAAAGAFIGNLLIKLINTIIDIFCVLWNFIAVFANFFGNVFNDPVNSIARLFFDLVDCILSLLQTLASAIDTLFGSNLAGAVQGWRDSLGGWVDKTFGQGEEIMATVNGQDYHFNRIEYGSAFNAGANWGDGIANSISGFSFSDLFNEIAVPNQEFQNGIYDASGASAGSGVDAAKTAANTGNTAANTAAIAESLDITNEELKYLRDIAERDVVNRFTTASIKVEMNNSNNISSDMDLDGIVNGLTNKVEEAMAQTAEGVHI